MFKIWKTFYILILALSTLRVSLNLDYMIEEEMEKRNVN